MNNSEIKLSTFETLPIKVAKAEYKDSTYFIANGKDITNFVIEVHGEVENVDIHSIQNVVNRYLEENPQDNAVQIPLYKFYLLDDPKTTIDFVNMYCNDILGLKRRRIINIVDDLNGSTGESYIGNYSREMVTTFSRILENGNVRFNFNLGSRIELVTPEQKLYDENFEVLEQLINRDYPEDL